MQKVSLKNHETWPEAFKDAIREQGLEDELLNNDCELSTINARMEIGRSKSAKVTRTFGSGFGLGLEPTGSWYFEFEILHRENCYSCLFVTDLISFDEAKEIVRSIENARTSK